MKFTKNLFMAALLCSIGAAHSQTYPVFQVSEDIDIGNIRATHRVHGDMWWDGDTSASCEFPKDSGKHIGYVNQMSICGKDASNTMLVSAQTYVRRIAASSPDFWPGPINSSATPSQKYDSSRKWAKIWKVSSNQIESFLSIQNHYILNTPAEILLWPAKGNPYAEGADEAALNITEDMAPFVDVNGDGKYNALDGDYPKIKGNQMIWCVFNDDGPVRTTAAPPLKMEIRMIAYAFKRGTIADNIIFYENELVNKSGGTLSEVRMGYRNGADLGNFFDDYIGLFSSLRMVVEYNGRSFDGNGGPGTYGGNIPMSATMFLELPGDNQTTQIPAGSCSALFNGAPVTPQQFWDDLHKTTPGITHDSECVAFHVPGDRAYALASNDLTFAPAEKKKIAWALLVSPNAGGCPNMSFTGIINTANAAKALYLENPNTTSTGSVPGKIGFHIYPNPTTDGLHIETGDPTPGSLSVLDAMGRVIQLPETRTAGRIVVNTSALPFGVYLIRYQNNGQTFTATFLRK